MEMGSENLRLSAEVIRLQGHLDRMTGHSYIDELARTRQMMQDKISELSGIVNGLGNTRAKKMIPGQFPSSSFLGLLVHSNPYLSHCRKKNTESCQTR